MVNHIEIHLFKIWTDWEKRLCFIWNIINFRSCLFRATLRYINYKTLVWNIKKCSPITKTRRGNNFRFSVHQVPSCRFQESAFFIHFQGEDWYETGYSILVYKRRELKEEIVKNWCAFILLFYKRVPDLFHEDGNIQLHLCTGWKEEEIQIQGK